MELIEHEVDNALKERQEKNKGMKYQSKTRNSYYHKKIPESNEMRFTVEMIQREFCSLVKILRMTLLNFRSLIAPKMVSSISSRWRFPLAKGIPRVLRTNEYTSLVPAPKDKKWYWLREYHQNVDGVLPILYKRRRRTDHVWRYSSIGGDAMHAKYNWASSWLASWRYETEQWDDTLKTEVTQIIITQMWCSSCTVKCHESMMAIMLSFDHYQMQRPYLQVPYPLLPAYMYMYLQFWFVK